MNVLDVISESMEDGKKVERLPSGGTKTTYNNGTIVYKDAEGNVHREDDLPAVHYETAVPSNEWYTHGVHTRIGKPATVYDNGNTTWYVNDQKHRIDGPAVDWKTKTFWFINGIELTDAVDPFMKKYGITYPYKKDEAAVAKLDANKKDVISFLLRLIKNTESQSEVALPFIYMLKATGVTWPELDAIQRSGEGSLQLNESAVDFDHQINKFVNELRKFRSYALIDLMDSAHHWQNGGATDADLLKIINTPEVTAAIKLWLSRVLAKPSDADMDILIHTLNLLTKIGVRWHKGDDNPFKDHKAEVIRSLLNRVKECDHYTRQFIIQELESLQLLGIDWPELDIIMKSVEADTQLDESPKYGLKDLDPITHTFMRNMVERLKDHQPFALTHTIVYLRDRGYTFDYINAALETKKADILKFFEHTLTDENDTNNVYNLVDQMDTLRMNGVKWPELTEYLEKYKATIIKDMLYNFRADNLDGIESMLGLLKRAHVKWPELRSISKSLQAAQKTHHVQMDEAIYDANIGPGYTRQLISRLTHPGAKPDDITYFIRNLEIAGYNYRQISNTFSQPDIVDLLKKLIDANFKASHWYPKFHTLNLLTKMCGYGMDIKWPKTNEPFESNKTSILRFILEVVRDCTKAGYTIIKPDKILDWMRALQYFGCDWPEFAVIAKSVNATTQIAEGVGYEAYTKAALDMTRPMFDRNGYNRGLEWLINCTKTTKIDPDAIEAFMDEYKPKLVKYLLEKITTDNLYLVKEIIDNLRDLHVKWPELDIISKSLHSEKYPMRESDDEDDYGLRDDALGMVKDRVVQGIEFMRKYGLTLNDVPKARAVIEKKKNTVIKHMLTKIKSAVNVHEIQRGYIFDYVTQLINDLKDWGIDWPEFNVIQKSLLGFHRELSMNENEVPWNARKYAVPDFEKAIIDKDSIGIMTRTLDALIRLEGIKYATEVMNLNKQNILDYLQHNLEDELGSRHGTSRDTVAPIKGFILLTRWPELTKMLTDNKERIIKKMLQEIIDNGMSDVIVTLDVLAKLGIDWPELAIIDKSLNAKKSNSAIAEALNVNPERYSRTIEKFDSMITNGDTYHSLDFLKKKMQFTDIPVQIIHHILDKHKSLIMKRILSMIASENTGSAGSLITLIQELDCKWPELEVMSASIKAIRADLHARYEKERQEQEEEYQREREEMQRSYMSERHDHFDPRYYESAFVNFKHMLMRGDAINGFWLLKDRLEKDLLPREAVDYVLNKYKYYIITQLLTIIADQGHFVVDQVRRRLEILKLLHCEWPELDTIEQSINAIAKELRRKRDIENGLDPDADN